MLNQLFKYQLFKPNYSQDLSRCPNPIIQKIDDVVQKQLFKNIDDTKVIIQLLFMKRLYPSNFQIYMRLSRSLHMHKTFGDEKSAPQARNFLTQELKQSFVVRKTW